MKNKGKTAVVLCVATLIGLGLFSAAMDRARCENAAQEMEDAALLQQEEIFAPLPEEPMEAERSAGAVILATREAATAQIAVGYDWDFVCRVVMAEAGGDTVEEQMAVATCCMNTCTRTLQNPAEVMASGYAAPAPAWTVTDEVRRSCERVFLMREILPEIEDGEIFYSTDGGFCSQWHESMEYVTTVGSIRVFRYPEEIRDAL